MSDNLSRETRMALVGALAGSIGTALLLICLWAISEAPTWTEHGPVAAGTTLMGGCPETVIVTLKKGETLMYYTESNVAEGFQLKGVNGQYWTVKLKKPEGQ